MERTARRRFPAMFQLTALYGAVLVLPLYLLYPDARATERLIASLPAAAAALRPFGAGDATHPVAVLVPCILAACAVAVAIRPAAGAVRPTGGGTARGTRGPMRPPYGPWGARFGKELAFLRRVYFVRALHAVAVALTALPVVSGAWWLLPSAALPWITLTHNLLGPDEPLGGRTRYRIAPVVLSRVLRARHAALFLLAGALLGAAALAGSLLHPATAAAHWAAGAGLGVAVVAAATLTGDRFSIGYPRWAGLRDVLLGGGFLRRRAWLGVAATYLGAGLALAGSVAVVGRVAGSSSDAAAAAAFVLCATVLWGAWGTGTYLLQRQNGRD